MSAPLRLAALRRLVEVYEAVEQMQLAELQKLTRMIVEVEQSIGAEYEVVHSSRAISRIALYSDDRISRRVADTEEKTAAMRLDLLEQVRQERVLQQRAALERYSASRIKREQMKRLHDDMTRDRAAEDKRRAQATSDDRFLARRRWVEAEEARRSQHKDSLIALP